MRVAELRLEGLETLPEPERLTLLERPAGAGGRHLPGERLGADTRPRSPGGCAIWGTPGPRWRARPPSTSAPTRPGWTSGTTPGRRYRFGEVFVQTGGARRAAREGRAPPPSASTRPGCASRCELALEDSPLYSDEALDEAQRRVFAMGIFSTVRVDTGDETPERAAAGGGRTCGPPPPTPCGWGAGVGFDQVRQEARLIAEWTDRNWLGGLRRLQARATAGWAFLPSTLAVVRNQLELGPRHGPHLPGRPSTSISRACSGRPSLGLNAPAGERAHPGADLRRHRRAPHDRGRWEPHSTLTVFPAYNLQGYWLEGPRHDHAQSAPLTLGCEEDPCFVLLSYLEQIVTWDTRDDPLQPRRGRYLSLSLQEGGRAAGRWVRLPAHLARGARLPQPGRGRSLHPGGAGAGGRPPHRQRGGPRTARW